MRLSSRICIIPAVIILLVSSIRLGHCDWLNLSGAENSPNIAEISVESDRVRIQLEIFVQDIKIFQDIIPDELFPDPIPGRPDHKARMAHFASQVFQVITDSGERLPVQVGLVEPRYRVFRPSPLVGTINPYTGRPILGPPEDKRVLYVELTYPFSGKPSSLTFIPPLDEEGILKASIGFICYHQGVLVVDFRQLIENNVLRLDWDDPWYSSFAMKQLQRALQSGMRTYLYIEPYEVRHEILVRIRDMMPWLQFDLRGAEYIEEDEFDPVRKKVADFFLAREKVLIDGKQLKPILDRTAFVESSMLRSRFIETPERVPLNTAMIGVVITYLTDGIPLQVETEWDLFSDRVQKVTGVMTDPAGPFPYDLTPDDRVLKWTNYLKQYTIPTVSNIEADASYRGIQLPVLSLACCGLVVLLAFFTFARRKRSRAMIGPLAAMAGLVVAAVLLLPVLRISIGSGVQVSQLSGEQCKAIVGSLLGNVYRAFDFREEEDVYDKLAISVDGDLLTDIYLQSRKSLEIEQAGGAQAKVKQVEVLATEFHRSGKQEGALEVRAKWSALGTVGHWGHVHTRRNVYDAILTLAIVDKAWKIVGIEVLEEKRIDPYAGMTGAAQGKS